LARKELAQSSVPHGFNAEVLVAAGDIVDTTLAEILQQELKPLGITLTLKRINPSNTLPEFEKFRYQLFHQFWTNDIADPDEQTTFFLDPAVVHSVFTGYNNPQVTSWVHQAARQFIKAKREALYAKIQAQQAKDEPEIPLFYVPYVWAYSTKVQGFRIFATANQDLVNVWLKQ
jgi:peptide/nickel transport system substrate-binding protein